MRCAGFRRADPRLGRAVAGLNRIDRTSPGLPSRVRTSARPSSRFLSRWCAGCAGRSRLSSQSLQNPLFFDSLQAALQKIDLQRLLADLPFELGNLGFIPAAFAESRKRVIRSLSELLPPTMEQVRIDFKCPRYLGGRCTRVKPL